MRYIKQQITAIDDTNTTDDYNEWNPATSYTVIESLSSQTNSSCCRYGAYYYVAIAPNTGMRPDENIDKYWMKWKISNKWACLDFSSLSKSEKIGGSLYYEFLQDRTLLEFVVGNFTAETLLFEVLDDVDAVLYSYETQKVSIRNITNWYNWTYREIDYTDDRTIWLKAPMVGTKVRITLNDSLAIEDTSVGYIFGGMGIDMGTSLSKVPFGINSYSKIEQDDFGTMTINERAKQDTVSFQTVLNSAKFVSKRRQAKSDFDKIVAFVVDENDDSMHENLITMGKMQNVNFILETHDGEQVVGWSIVEVI